ncbi:MAG: hypothetical protein K0S74_1138 [Chlamydiales bacterium]|jgi:chromosome segregation ATPase|nr:hypothetical protein [Chlamydiales bacterium]
MSMTVNHSNPISSPSQEVVPLSEHNALIEQMSHMMLATMQADQTVQEETNLLIRQFQVSMREQQRAYEAMVEKAKQLEIENTALKGRISELQRSHNAEVSSLQEQIRGLKKRIKELAGGCGTQ